MSYLNAREFGNRVNIAVGTHFTMFKRIFQFLNGEFAMTDRVKSIHANLDEVRRLPIDDAMRQAKQIIGDETLFEVLEEDHRDSRHALPKHAENFFAAYGHVICLRNNIEMDASRFVPWGSDTGYLRIGESADGVALLLGVDSERVLEVDSPDVNVEVDGVPTIFHWVVLQGRLSKLDD